MDAHTGMEGDATETGREGDRERAKRMGRETEGKRNKESSIQTLVLIREDKVSTVTASGREKTKKGKRKWAERR